MTRNTAEEEGGKGTGWIAESTDPEGVVGPLRLRAGCLQGMRVAVVGSGGAGRAAALGLKEAGCDVTLVNRSVPPGKEAATRLGVEFVALEDLDVDKARGRLSKWCQRRSRVS